MNTIFPFSDLVKLENLNKQYASIIDEPVIQELEKQGYDEKIAKQKNQRLISNQTMRSIRIDQFHMLNSMESGDAEDITSIIIKLTNLRSKLIDKIEKVGQYFERVNAALDVSQGIIMDLRKIDRIGNPIKFR